MIFDLCVLLCYNSITQKIVESKKNDAYEILIFPMDAIKTEVYNILENAIRVAITTGRTLYNRGAEYPVFPDEDPGTRRYRHANRLRTRKNRHEWHLAL